MKSAEELKQVTEKVERKKLINPALLMLADNEATNKISRYTGLSETEILELAAKHSA